MDWKSRTRAAFVPPAAAPEDDVIEELAQHVRAVHEAALADGLSPDQADRRVAEHLERWQRDAVALRRRSRRQTIVESPPDGSSSSLTGLARDIHYAGRLLRRQPRFALLAMATMALGITATTVLFSVTYGVLLKPLPWPHAGRLVALEETRGGNRPRFGAFSNAVYLTWREQASTIDGIAAWALRTVTLG